MAWMSAGRRSTSTTGSLHVRILQDIEEATWDRWLLECPGGGHVLQTHAWGTFKATQGWMPLRLALFEGQRVVGLAQLLLRRPPWIPGTIAYCPMGPALDWSNDEHVHVMLAGMEREARRRSAIVLKVEGEVYSGPGQPKRTGTGRPDPGTPGMQRQQGEGSRVSVAREAILAAWEVQARDGCTPGRRALTARGFVKSLGDVQPRTTMMMDLTCSSDELLRRMKSKWRYNIGLAFRKGVTVQQDNSPVARRLLNDMQIRTGQRGRFFVRPQAYFDRVFDIMIAAGHGHIFIASHNGRPLAAAMIFTFGRKAWYQYGASEAAGRHLMPSYALQFQVMQWAHEHGITQYDQVGIPDVENISDMHPMWDLYVAKYGYGGRIVEWVGACDKALGLRGRLWTEYAPLYHVFHKQWFKDYLY